MIRKANINDTEGLIKLLSQVHALHAKGRPDIFKPGGIKYTKENISEILKNENTPVFVFANEEDSVEGYVFCELKETAEDTSLQNIVSSFYSQTGTPYEYRQYLNTFF